MASPRQSRKGGEGKITFLGLNLLAMLFNPPKDHTGLLGHNCTLLVHGQPFVHQEPQVLLCRVLLQQVSPQPVLMYVVISPQFHHATFAFVEPHKAPFTFPSSLG